MRRLLSLGLTLLMLGAAAPVVWAQPTGDLTGFGFLRLEPSARAAALGGAFSAVYGDDVNGLFYNPGLLNEAMHRGLSVSYLNHVADLNMGFLAYARHLDRVGTVGAGIRFLNWGTFERADADGNRDGTFGASDVALTLGIGRAYTERLRYGANVHTIFSSVESYRAAALAADLGVVFVVPEQRLTLSASANNVGVTLSSLGATRDELPTDLRLSVAKRLQYVPILVSLTGYNLHAPGANMPDDATALDNVLHHLAVGTEFQFSEAFQLRFGYNHRRHEALKTKSRLDLAGFGMGVGLNVTRVRFDYAFNSWSENGRLHQFTLRTVL